MGAFEFLALGFCLFIQRFCLVLFCLAGFIIWFYLVLLFGFIWFWLVFVGCSIRFG